jgi:hypothetical protein
MAYTVDRLGPGAIRVTMGTDFRPEDAWQIHELLEKTDPGTHVEVDFRRVRECADFALSLLARDILGGRVHVDMQGMSQHQERVLSYFGVTAASHEAMLDFDPI